MTAITSKRQMYGLLRSGALGNTLRTWATRENYLEAGFRGRTSLRCLVPGVTFRHGLTHEDVLVQGAHSFEGQPPEAFVYCEAAPDEQVVLQGEVSRIAGGLYMAWSRERCNMRVATSLGWRHASGLTAKVLLEASVDPSSLEDIELLLDKYHDHVIEFSAFSVALGLVPRRNTVIWEVRRY